MTDNKVLKKLRATMTIYKKTDLNMLVHDSILQAETKIWELMKQVRNKLSSQLIIQLHHPEDLLNPLTSHKL